MQRHLYVRLLNKLHFFFATSQVCVVWDRTNNHRRTPKLVMSQDYESNSPAATFDLDVMGVIRRRARHVVFGVLLGVCAGLLYYFATPPKYESRLEILVGQRSSEMTNRGTANDGYASGSTIQEDVLATHMDILTSKKVLIAAVKKEKLDELYSFKKADEKGVSAVEHILEHLEVGRGGEGLAKDANVLTAYFRDTRPEDAAVVLDAIFEGYKSFVKTQWSNHSEEAAGLLKQAQNTHEAELAAADEAYRQFIKSVPVFVDGDTISDVHRDRLNNLEAELNEVRSTLTESQSRREVIEAYMKEDVESEMTDINRLALLSENEVNRLKLFLEMTRGDFRNEELLKDQPIRVETAKAQYTRLLDLYQKQRKLTEDFGPGHPTVQATMQEIEVIKDFIAKTSPEDVESEADKQMTATEMLAAYQQLLQHDQNTLAIREKTLNVSIKKELALAKEVEADFLKGTSLKAKLDRAQYRYDEVVRRLQEINIAGNFAGFSTDLLESPKPASKPSWPQLPLSIAVGLLLGGLLGLTTGLIAELADSTFRDAKDLESAANAPILTHVAPFDMRKLRQLVDGDSGLAPQLCTFHGPRSQEAEVYRTARTSLLLGCSKFDRKVLMMTSAAPGDGKSTTVANLAISLAQTGKRVLLIDADLRRPMVYNIFGANGAPGLTDIINESKTLADVVQQSEQENLDLLTHGTRTGSPAEILESFHFSTLLEECRREYDFVLIDAPPVLAVADPAIIAALTDGIIITVQIQKNGRRPVERALDILDGINTLVGIIVNNSDERTKGYGYSHDYYGDAYGYIGKYYDDYSAPDAPLKGPSKRQKVTSS